MLKPSLPTCPDCGLLHPIPLNGKCPLKNSESKETPSNLHELLYIPIKDLVETRIKNDRILNTEKFFSYIVNNISNIIKSYKE